MQVFFSKNQKIFSCFLRLPLVCRAGFVYNKMDINNRWSLVGPGEETYTNFTYETYTVPTVVVRKVTDSFDQTVLKAMGVYSLYEETDSYKSFPP